MHSSQVSQHTPKRKSSGIRALDKAESNNTLRAEEIAEGIENEYHNISSR